uniref:Cytochrome b6-f complex subunit PetN n=1 Tax=Alexandrium catenella TaxID=2925 RepID=A0A6T9RDN2_ALECA|mmetsp:Transcript_62047/g.166044  ORF Transcript_62047/g.166044 Transcript_62047/m.166044 type:complete len:150 (+) Transcript_62047:104-553(+)|eukprot:CAMPEP_0171172120 /NCGR_PEP_ID=MMETSP0790-20130122/9561_1 /TAXON_ID=2925 /ORGANISM="Alexandrium catenella, Strain OF101" /LENGTH=149 /DNA_ID=CAMNT_0011636979 /DNA_START=91 /DNA_END=540 /DNA_ORIENTATION=-
MAPRQLVLALAAGLTASASAYVQPARGGPLHLERLAQQAPPSGPAPAAVQPRTETSAGKSSEPLGLAALGCVLGAVAGWVSDRRRQVAASVAAGAAGLAPLSAMAEADGDGSSLRLAMDPLSNPDLGFVFMTSLASMSIALVVWGRNGL